MIHSFYQVKERGPELTGQAQRSQIELVSISQKN